MTNLSHDCDKRRILNKEGKRKYVGEIVSQTNFLKGIW